MYAMFYFRDQPRDETTTGVSGDVSDTSFSRVLETWFGARIPRNALMGWEAERVYVYRLADGNDIQVTMLLDRVSPDDLSLAPPRYRQD